MCIGHNAINIAIAFFAVITPVSSYADSYDVKTIAGNCTDASHTADGPIGSDLTKRQSRFYCNAAVIAYFDKNRKHLQINFTQKESMHNQILGFSGWLEENGIMLKLSKVYLNPGKSTTVSDGWCKFFLSGANLKSIFCGMSADEAGRRTTAMVIFDIALP